MRAARAALCVVRVWMRLCVGKSDLVEPKRYQHWAWSTNHWRVTVGVCRHQQIGPEFLQRGRMKTRCCDAPDREEEGRFVLKLGCCWSCGSSAQRGCSLRVEPRRVALDHFRVEPARRDYRVHCRETRDVVHTQHSRASRGPRLNRGACADDLRCTAGAPSVFTNPCGRSRYTRRARKSCCQARGARPHPQGSRPRGRGARSKSRAGSRGVARVDLSKRDQLRFTGITT
jgi:hypothetical protein